MCFSFENDGECEIGILIRTPARNTFMYIAGEIGK